MIWLDACLKTLWHGRHVARRQQSPNPIIGHATILRLNFKNKFYRIKIMTALVFVHEMRNAKNFNDQMKISEYTKKTGKINVAELSLYKHA